MTNMKRITVSFPDDIEHCLDALKKTESNAKCSYAEIIRRLVRVGLEASDREREEAS